MRKTPLYPITLFFKGLIYSIEAVQDEHVLCEINLAAPHTFVDRTYNLKPRRHDRQRTNLYDGADDDGRIG